MKKGHRKFRVALNPNHIKTLKDDTLNIVVGKTIKIKGYEEFKLFIHKKNRTYWVSEKTTGRRVFFGKNKDAQCKVINDCKDYLDTSITKKIFKDTIKIRHNKEIAKFNENEGFFF